MRFQAQIKDIKTRNCVSGDITTRITLEQDNLSPESLAMLNAIIASERNKSREVNVSFE